MSDKFGKDFQGLSAGILVHIPLYCRFPVNCLSFLDVLSAENIFKQNKNTSVFPRINLCCFRRQVHSSSSVRVQSAK